MAYSAFISYSHAADGKLAPALQSALHRFAKPWYRLRQLRVFRDKTSLSADPALWSAIERALKESKWFLLMASPDSACSRWVQKEVEWWVEHKDPMSVLILLTEGNIAWDAERKDFDWTRTPSLPQTLAGRFAEEPLYVNLRWARTDENLSLRSSQFRSAILDIAAPLHGRSKDELDGEDVRNYRRTRRLTVCVMLVVALWQRSRRGRRTSQHNSARKRWRNGTRPGGSATSPRNVAASPCRGNWRRSHGARQPNAWITRSS